MSILCRSLLSICVKNLCGRFVNIPSISPTYSLAEAVFVDLRSQFLIQQTH